MACGMSDKQKINEAIPLLIMGIATGCWGMIEHALEVLTEQKGMERNERSLERYT
jgi:hypothetical protein